MILRPSFSRRGKSPRGIIQRCCAFDPIRCHGGFISMTRAAVREQAVSRRPCSTRQLTVHRNLSTPSWARRTSRGLRTAAVNGRVTGPPSLSSPPLSPISSHLNLSPLINLTLPRNPLSPLSSPLSSLLPHLSFPIAVPHALLIFSTSPRHHFYPLLSAFTPLLSPLSSLSSL